MQPCTALCKALYAANLLQTQPSIHGNAQEAYRRAAAEWHRALHADDRPLVEEQMRPSQWEPVLILQQHIVSGLPACMRPAVVSMQLHRD